MPFIQLAPAYAHPFGQQDPLLDFISAVAFGAEQSQAKKPEQASSTARSQSQPAKTPRAACAAACASRQQRAYKRIINPSFDVSENPESYVLEGELSGVSDKSSISISFDNAQTIVIKGEVKRVNRLPAEEQAVVPAAKPVESTEETVTYDDASSTTKGHSVTVEEVEDESETASNDDFEVVDGPKVNKGKARASDDVEMTEAAPQQQKAEQPKQEAPKPSVPQPRYWISERSIGVFERRFNFQGLIDQDAVKAHLENGLLTIVVPKRKAYVRQVNIE